MTGQWSEGVRPATTVRSMLAATTRQSGEQPIQSIRSPAVFVGSKPLKVASGPVDCGTAARSVSRSFGAAASSANKAA